MLKNLLKKFFVSKREKMAMVILNGMISADWNMAIPDGMTWDEVAVDRAYKIVDLLIENN